MLLLRHATLHFVTLSSESNRTAETGMGGCRLCGTEWFRRMVEMGSGSKHWSTSLWQQGWKQLLFMCLFKAISFSQLKNSHRFTLKKNYIATL